jgi:hypothetical protein
LPWLLLPALAVAAYITVLRIGFLSDDLLLLHRAAADGIGPGVLLPSPDWPFYRPFGTLVTWQLGWQLWHFNPFPYHLIGLLVHGGASLALGLWVSEISGLRPVGLIAGALFAVFPLHLEAVGWLAAQWDAWAVLFVLLSLWLFAAWWRTRRAVHYVLALLLYGLAVYSKESMFTLLPVFFPSVVLSPEHRARPRQFSDWRLLVLSLVPFAGFIAINVGTRLAVWGNLGGYQGASVDYPSFVWDALVKYGRVLFVPLNTLIWSPGVTNIVAVVVLIGWLAGLVYFGYRWRGLLFLSGLWIALSLAPVLNLNITVSDLGNNRFFYAISAGYCAAAAALLYSAVSSTPTKWRAVPVGIFGTLLLAGIVASWAQLRPWHVATESAAELEHEIRRLIPLQERPAGLVWYVVNAPDNYQGAYIYRLGLGNMRYFTGKGLDTAATVNIGHEREALLAEEHRDSFALVLATSEDGRRTHVREGTGISFSIDPPALGDRGQASDNLTVWDFTKCAPGAVEAWSAANARATCTPGNGLAVDAVSDDPILLGPGYSLGSGVEGARFLRLRVAARYPSVEGVEQPAITWHLTRPGESEPDVPVSIPVKTGPENGGSVKPEDIFHAYWAFIPLSDLPGPDIRLRFDPINGQLPTEIRWIAADLVR